MHVLHKCDTPACVNPDHLRLGTHQENMRDRDSKKRTANCKGDAAHRRILTSHAVESIRRDVKDGVSRKYLASLYGVSISTIHAVVIRQNWK